MSKLNSIVHLNVLDIDFNNLEDITSIAHKHKKLGISIFSRIIAKIEKGLSSYTNCKIGGVSALDITCRDYLYLVQCVVDFKLVLYLGFTNGLVDRDISIHLFNVVNGKERTQHNLVIKLHIKDVDIVVHNIRELVDLINQYADRNYCHCIKCPNNSSIVKLFSIMC